MCQSLSSVSLAGEAPKQVEAPLDVGGVVLDVQLVGDVVSYGFQAAPLPELVVEVGDYLEDNVSVFELYIGR